MTAPEPNLVSQAVHEITSTGVGARPPNSVELLRARGADGPEPFRSRRRIHSPQPSTEAQWHSSSDKVYRGDRQPYGCALSRQLPCGVGTPGPCAAQGQPE